MKKSAARWGRKGQMSAGQRSDLEADLRRREAAALARIRREQSASRRSSSSIASAEREEASAERDIASSTAEQALAEREGLHEIAEALQAGRGQRPSSTPLVLVFLLAFTLAAAGLDPLIVLVTTLVGLFIVLVRLGSGELSNPINLFYIIFVMFHLFVDATSSFAFTPARWSTLFSFGLFYWLLFERKRYGLSWNNIKPIVGSLSACIGAFLLYGFVPTIFSYVARLGVGTEILNVVLVMGPIVGLLFILDETLLTQSMKQFILLLAIFAFVSYIYNVGISGSPMKVVFAQTQTFTAERWGAASDFFMFFLTPIQHSLTNFKEFMFAPACHKFFDWFEMFLLGELPKEGSGMGNELCPKMKTKEEQVPDGKEATKGSGGIQGWIDKRIAFATGQVEETKTEPPGVTISPIQLQSSAVENQPVTVRSKVRAVALDKPLDLNLFCEATGEKKVVTAKSFSPDAQKESGGDPKSSNEKKEEAVTFTASEIIPGKTMRVRSKEKAERGVVCVYDSLEAQTYTFSVQASFDFKTVSYLKVYFASEDQIDALGGSDAWFSRYRISDRQPEPKYTPGPVALGIRIEEPMPIVLYPKASPQRLFLDIPVQNAYKGKVRGISKFFIALPKGLALEGVYGGKEAGELTEVSCGDLDPEDARGCDDELFTLYLVGVKEKDVESMDYRVSLRVDDYSQLLGSTPPSTQFIKVIMDYDYVLKEKSGGLVVEKAASAKDLVNDEGVIA